VDAALTVKPRIRSVPPARSAFASSMQSPPASAEKMSVRSLSPTFARPGFAPRIEMALDELLETQVLGEGGRQEQACVGHQVVVVKGRREPVEASSQRDGSVRRRLASLRQRMLATATR